MAPNQQCFPLRERLLWAILFACAAYAGGALGVPQPPKAAPLTPNPPAPSVAPTREPPAAEARPQRALVGRRRDGQWVRVEEHAGQITETVISQGVVRPGPPFGESGP